MTSRSELYGSGIVSLRKSTMDAATTAEKMEKKGVCVAPRSGWVRASPHFYQNEQDIHRFIDLLP
mgnify:CR=1 FL=1